MKKIIIYTSVFIGVIMATFVYVAMNKKSEILEIVEKPIVTKSIDMCYQYSKKTSSGLVDRSLLKMSITGDKVSGEYQNLPAEKDSKVGKFTGTVGAMDPKISARIASLWWDSSAEGMNVKEQLKIEFGEGSAVAFFGEMVDKGDGVYVYKDITKLTPGFQMSQTDCDNLNVKVNSPELIFCTLDAKQCSDGTYVGRTGPKCEFVCPK